MNYSVNPWTMDWKLSWLEAELTTNYAYIRKLVKICVQLLGPCRLSNFSAIADNMELCSMSCLVLSPQLPTTTTASADIRYFFWRKKSVNQIDLKVVFLAYSRDKVQWLSWDSRESQPPSPHVWSQCDGGACLAVKFGINIWVELTCMWMNWS